MTDRPATAMPGAARVPSAGLEPDANRGQPGAAEAGAGLVSINRDPTSCDYATTAVIREPIGQAVPRLADLLIAASPALHGKHRSGGTEGLVDELLPPQPQGHSQRS
jgi:hypothetical protein